jgi:dipeptidase D
MSNSITNLEPKAVWTHFANLCNIPRPSKKEQKAVEYVSEFGRKLKLETLVDSVGNVIIRKPASPGMENRKGVVLQGHLDMVPQKNSDVQHDFEKDPILPYIDGEWVKAKGTTLGSDNGMGVSAALAVLEGKDIVHGPIEVLFTIDEETGMTGAFELKPGVLKGDILINMDSEDEGELYVGCAGGLNASAAVSYQEEKTPAGFAACRLILKGLKGGHSGVDIHLGRGNANKFITRFLRAADKKFDIRINYLEGGNLRNAIPREAFAVIAMPSAQQNDFCKFVTEFEAILSKEFKVTEPGMTFTCEKAEVPALVMNKGFQKRFVNAVFGIPNGVARMSDSIPGLVESSNNLAVVKAQSGQARVLCLLRSSVDSAKEGLADRIAGIFELANIEIAFDGAYPGWKPNPNSAILQIMKGIYEKKFGKVPEIKAIHAGLECGIIGGVYPNFDMVSFGPTIRYPHSPDEKVHIESVNKFYTFLLETLKNIPVKQ